MSAYLSPQFALKGATRELKFAGDCIKAATQTAPLVEAEAVAHELAYLLGISLASAAKTVLPLALHLRLYSRPAGSCERVSLDEADIGRLYQVKKVERIVTRQGQFHTYANPCKPYCSGRY